MIPTRRDLMLTEILLVIQILKSVYMILPFIPPRRDLGNRCRLNEMRNKHFIPPNQDEKLPYKHFIPAIGGMNFSLLNMHVAIIATKI